MALLLEQGCVSKSECSRAFLTFVMPLLQSGVLVEERAGAGRRLTIHDSTAIQHFFTAHFPGAECGEHTPKRISSVGRFRDSKALTGDTADVVLLRAWSNTALWCGDSPVSAAANSSAHGVFSFVLRSDSNYDIRSRCALVENPAMLLNFERLGLTAGIPIALYAGGRISNRVLQWLAKMKHQDFVLTHFPDYDPVGLSEFVRVRSALRTRAALYMPPDLEANFSRFANSGLLQRKASQLLLPGLRTNCSAEIRAVLTLIDRHNAGLEQEALLLSSHERGP